MKYRIRHLTTYRYTGAVTTCHNEIHLAPRNAPTQRCERYELFIEPNPAGMGSRLDFFGNPTHYFSIHESHLSLTLHAVTDVQIQPKEFSDPSNSPRWEDVRRNIRKAGMSPEVALLPYTFDSPLVSPSSELQLYALESFWPDRPIAEAAIELTSRIFNGFVYDTEATDVFTPLHDVFGLKRGVCQDFAHVAIGCLRSIGLPARYVSGYIRTQPAGGKTKLIGTDASHAWISVYCGPYGWLDLDPTNNLVVHSDHITLAWGRDYSDVTPVKGVVVGGGDHRLNVSVDVTVNDESR